MKYYDIIIIGAGAAGLSAAATALKRGKSVAIIEMYYQPARKVMVSGGGRCNFTNDAVEVNKYFGKNPNFVRSAITRVTPGNILTWATDHQIQFEEKNPGQYFCVQGAQNIVKALLKDVATAKMYLNTQIKQILHLADCFQITSNIEIFTTKSIIIATGGTSFSSLGTSDFGYKIAKQFGHKIIPIRPALCAISTKIFPADLSGISLPVEIRSGKTKIYDYLLFTHFGISGPATYRITVRDFEDIHINLLPNLNVYDFLRKAKKTSGRKKLAGILSEKLPMKLAKWISDEDKNIADYKDSDLYDISIKITDITLNKNAIKLHNLQSAEVVRGGIDTNDISSKTMESKLCPGLFFAGEVMDIAGDLGGFNLHWAWASGHIAGENA